MKTKVIAALVPAIALLVIGNFAAYAVFGANGILALGDYRAQLGQRTAELRLLDQERAKLAHRVALLDPKKADPDMADELIRKDLGLARPDEVILQVR